MTEVKWIVSTDPIAMMVYLADRHVEGFRTSDGPRRRISTRKLRLFACACCRSVWHLLTDKRSRRAVEVVERFADGEVAPGGLPRARTTAADARFDPPGGYGATGAWLAHVTTADECGSFVAVFSRTDSHPLVPPATQAALLREIVGNPFRPVPRWRAPFLYQQVEIERMAEAIYQERPGWMCDECQGTGNRPNGYCLADPRCPHCHGTGRVEDGALDPFRLALMADALEEAGCTEEALLRHLRGEERFAEACRRCSGDGKAHGADRPFEWSADVDYGKCMVCKGSGHAQPDWHPLRGPHVRGCWALDLVLGKE